MYLTNPTNTAETQAQRDRLVEEEDVLPLVTEDMEAVACSELLSFEGLGQEDLDRFVARFLARVLGASDDSTRARLFRLYGCP